MKRRNLLGLMLGSAAGVAATAGGIATAIAGEEPRAAGSALRRGGSNYNWYRLDGCTREPYGVVNSFHRAPETIRAQLAAMHSAGQRRLRIGIYHRNGPDTGTVMNSAGGNLSTANRANLRGLLAAVKAAGFAEVQIAFHPIGGNDPSTWSAFNDDRYRDNWSLIRNLRPLIRDAGIPYRIDLVNEGMPAPGQETLLRYSRRLWSNYTQAYGKSDTLGISCIGELARVKRMREVYGSNAPYRFSFHFYGDSVRNEREQFIAADAEVRRMGYGSQSWIIGETYYNSYHSAARLQQAIAATGRTVQYLCQWPVTRDRRCQHVDVAPPKSFGNFVSRGF